MADWVSAHSSGIIDGIISGAALAALAMLFRLGANKVNERRFNVSGWYLTRYDYHLGEPRDAAAQHRHEESKALLHLSQRGKRLSGSIQSPDSEATFSLKGRVTDLYELYGRYVEDRKRGASQVFFKRPKARGDDPAREFEGIWGGYSATYDTVTSGFDDWRELLRVRVTAYDLGDAHGESARRVTDYLRSRGPGPRGVLRDGLGTVGGTLLIAQTGGKVVGAARLRPLDQSSAEFLDAELATPDKLSTLAPAARHLIDCVFVEPWARRRGVGNQLTRKAVDLLHAQGSLSCVTLASDHEMNQVDGVLAMNGFQRAAQLSGEAGDVRWWLYLSDYPHLRRDWSTLSWFGRLRLRVPFGSGS